MRPCEGQMELGLTFASGTPGSCPHEAETVGEGPQAKSRCALMDAWTNCREWQYCTYDSWKSREGK